MLIYKRVGNVVTPYWINTVTGQPEKLTYEQLIQGGDIPGANEPFIDKDKRYVYSRVNWPPFFVQPTDRYVNPRMLKPDGTRITDNDWFYRD